jgi:putative intracellular protease/amidase
LLDLSNLPQQRRCDVAIQSSIRFMSSNVNSSRAAPARILMVAANPATSTITGWPVGFWAAELTHPYWTFVESGYAVDIVSPKGGSLAVDTYSDPRDASGYSADDLLSLGFLSSPKHAALLQDTRSIDGVDVAGYDAIFLVGGQSPMFTFIDDAGLHQLVARFYEAGKVVAAVCHATCALLKTRLSSGDLLVKDKTWTGFANSEEQYADSFVGRRLQPFWIEDEAKKLPDTNFVVHSRFREFALRDGRLVTGQQQFSGAAAAALVVEALGI